MLVGSPANLQSTSVAWVTFVKVPGSVGTKAADVEAWGSMVVVAVIL
jgi:hypothetical protein